MSPAYGMKGYGGGEYGVITTMTKEAKIEVTVEEKGKITVTVTDKDGNAVSGMSASLLGASSASASTNENGVVEFSGLVVDSYEIELSKTGYFEKMISVAPEDFE